MNQLTQLGLSFDLEPLHPFGLKVTAKTSMSIEEVPGELLDQWVNLEKLVVLRGFSPIDRDGFLNYCRKFPRKKLLEWDFGPVMEMKEVPDPKNYLFSRERVPFHWDGAFHRVPAYLAFYCVEAPIRGAGGATLFANTEKIWNEASAAQKFKWQQITLSYETAKLSHYGGSIIGPLVQRHPESGHTILRFAEAVQTELNPVTLRIRGIPEVEQDHFIDEMEHKIYSPAFCYQHTWEPSDVLLADNHSLIHGRNAFDQNSPRHLRRIQLI